MLVSANNANVHRLWTLEPWYSAGMRVCEVGIASASVINGLSNFTDYWKRKVLEKFVPNINLDVKMLQLKFTNDVKVMLVDAEAARCPMVVTAYY